MTKAKKEKPEIERNKKIEPKDKKAIVIEETEDDILTSEILGDPDDFKKEVTKEAKKGRLARILAPILFFLMVGGAVGFATWYYREQNKKEEPKKIEEKIQTPPAVDEIEDQIDPNDSVEVEKPTATENVETEKTYTTYVVKEGDTLSGIANNHDMTSIELAKYNGISVDSVLHIGQKLKIPNK